MKRLKFVNSKFPTGVGYNLLLYRDWEVYLQTKMKRSTDVCILVYLQSLIFYLNKKSGKIILMISKTLKYDVLSSKHYNLLIMVVRCYVFKKITLRQVSNVKITGQVVSILE